MHAPHMLDSIGKGAGRARGGKPGGEGGGGWGHFLVMGYWGCASGCGHIFATGLTIVGSPFQTFSVELLEWGYTFSGL